MSKYANRKTQLTDRFISYAKIDTQSDPSSITCPSTAKQKNLGNLLVKELLAMGIADTEMDDNGYVYATLAATSSKKIPVICFCSHMDTSPDCSGADVKPIVHSNYQGEDLVLPDDDDVTLRLAEHPDLAAQFGNDIITASGTTLLGADNKAGIAAIMEAVAFLKENKTVKRGIIKILFTPDEEIGRGVDKADLKKLAADYAYTVDGETLGSIENETFSADGATLTIYGVSTHPGFAKGKMQSAIKILAEVIEHLPKTTISPETTENKEGFIHPVGISGSVEKAEAQFIIRDFDDEKLKRHGELLGEIIAKTISEHQGTSFDLEIKEQYRNMKQILDHYPKVTEIGIEAIKRAGIEPKLQSIRGGTDGSRLSFMGLPCPNIFAGEHAFHSKQEWVSVQDMEKAVQTIINIACIWEERS